MSLLVHPDKCSHPQAHQAFIKLNKAFKELQDPEKVSLLEGWFITEVNGAFCGTCLQLFLFVTYLINCFIYIWDWVFFCFFLFFLVDCCLINELGATWK